MSWCQPTDKYPSMNTDYTMTLTNMYMYSSYSWGGSTPQQLRTPIYCGIVRLITFVRKVLKHCMMHMFSRELHSKLCEQRQMRAEFTASDDGSGDFVNVMESNSQFYKERNHLPITLVLIILLTVFGSLLKTISTNL